MAWSTPATWVAGAVLTAAQLNAQLRDNLNAAFPGGVDAWTAWTPTVTQGVSVTVTVNKAGYMKVGRMVHLRAVLSPTSTGTAANPVEIGGLPFAILEGATLNTHTIGTMLLLDASIPDQFTGFVAPWSATTLRAQSTRGSGLLGQVSFTAALTTSDKVTFSATYEATT